MIVGFALLALSVAFMGDRPPDLHSDRAYMLGSLAASDLVGGIGAAFVSAASISTDDLQTRTYRRWILIACVACGLFAAACFAYGSSARSFFLLPALIGVIAAYVGTGLLIRLVLRR
jgi:lipopolysaccharide export LptBFGC system permease protein LptF